MFTLVVWLKWLERRPENQNVTGSTPGHRARAGLAGSVLSRGACERHLMDVSLHIGVSPSLQSQGARPRVSIKERRESLRSASWGLSLPSVPSSPLCPVIPILLGSPSGAYVNVRGYMF